MKILCNGCSFTYGAGFLDHERNDLIWSTLLGKKLDAQTTNIAFPGSSNLEIFLRTLKQLDQDHYDLVIIQWTSFRRHWFEPSLDRLFLCAGDPEEQFEQDWQNHEIYLKAKDCKNFYKTLLMLSGDYKECMDLAVYCKTLLKLQQPNQKIVFVNGILPWTPEIINPPELPFDMFTTFSEFTKNMLEFDNRDDDEIKKYFYNLHEQIKPTLSHWVNVNDPWSRRLLDNATLGHHPGPKSHQWLADKVLNYLVDQKTNTVV